MKKKLQKNKNYKKQVVLESLLLTITLHALLLILFSYSSNANNLTTENNVGITLYNTSNLSSSELQKFNDFLELNDPSLMVKSYTDNGFDHEFEKNTNRQIGNTDFQFSDAKYLSSLPDHSKQNPFIEPQIANSKFIDNLDGFTKINKGMKNQHYPFAVGSNGDVIILFFSQEQENIFKKHKLSNTTIKVVDNRDQLMNFNIINSCGRRDIDILAQNLLTQELLNKNLAIGTIYSIYYQEENYD